MVKRSGPLLAVVLNPTDADSAERMLSQIKYQATVTRASSSHAATTSASGGKCFPVSLGYCLSSPWFRGFWWPVEAVPEAGGRGGRGGLRYYAGFQPALTQFCK